MKISEQLQGFGLDKELLFSEIPTPGYRRTLARFVEFLGDMETQDVTSADIRRFLALQFYLVLQLYL